MNEQNNTCIDGRCPAGVDEIRKIGLTRNEKRAIFHSILNLSKVAQPVRVEEERVA